MGNIVLECLHLDHGAPDVRCPRCPATHRVRRRTVGIAVAVAIGTALLPAQGSARGGSYPRVEPWNGDPVAQLPPTVRGFVTSACHGGTAKRSFASHPDAEHIVLHYERLHCADRPVQCGASGCLHQEYAMEHGGWHLVRSTYEPGHE